MLCNDSDEWSSLFLTRVFLAMHRCCTRQIKEKVIVNGRNIFLCLHTSATVVAPPNSAYVQEVIPLFSATSCTIRNIDEVVEYCSKEEKKANNGYNSPPGRGRPPLLSSSNSRAHRQASCGKS